MKQLTQFDTNPNLSNSTFLSTSLVKIFQFIENCTNEGNLPVKSKMICQLRNKTRFSRKQIKIDQVTTTFNI